MDNQYQYRKHIKYLRYIIPITLLSLLFIMWVIILLFGKETSESLFSIIPLSLVIVFETIFVWIYFGRFLQIRVNIGLDAITYSNYNGKMVINYEDITKIEFPSIRYFGGWIKVKSKEETIRLTVVIENIQNLLMDLKAELDKRELSDKYESHKFFKFLKTATFSDEGWRRVYRIWWKLLLLTLITSGTGLGIGIIFNFDGSRVFLSGLISFIYPIAIYIITEIFFGMRIAKLADKSTFIIPKTDIRYEERIYKKTFLLATVVYLIFLIVEVLFT